MKDKVTGVLKGLRKSESGFTLIEMLIVVGIIVALAAAIVPQVVQFGERGTEGQAATEEASLQTAIDGMLADALISTVTANDPAVNSWSAVNADLGGTAVYPTYLSTATTTYFYCWNTAGRIVDQLETAAACP